MACWSTDSVEAWIEHAERALFVLANELRRVPLEPDTRRMHVRALELKREVARWRDRRPDIRERSAILEEIEALAREAEAHRRGPIPPPPVTTLRQPIFARAS